MVMIHGVTDVLIEWVSEIPETRRHKNLRYLFLIIMITCLGIAFWEGMLGFVLLAIPPLIVFLVMNANRCMDYDFQYCEGEFRVTAIKGKHRRKKAYVCSLEQIERFADRYDADASPKKFFGEDREEAASTLYVNGDKGMEAIAFEADSRFRRIFEVTGRIR